MDRVAAGAISDMHVPSWQTVWISCRRHAMGEAVFQNGALTIDGKKVEKVANKNVVDVIDFVEQISYYENRNSNGEVKVQLETKDEDGDKPTVGQFTQQSMSPYTEQLRTLAALFAGETGLTLDDLGFATENPSSAEAIKASHENLRLTARKAQRTFGSGFLNAGYLAACVRDDFAYQRSQLYLTKPAWEPVFEPDAAMLGLIGDGAVKINQAVPEYFGKENLRNLIGIDSNL